MQDTPAFDVNLSSEAIEAFFRAGYACTLNSLTDGRLATAVECATRTYLGYSALLTGPEEHPPPDDASDNADGPSSS